MDQVFSTETSPLTLFLLQVFCFIAVGLFIVLAVFLVIYMIKDWNSKVVKATLKEAVTG